MYELLPIITIALVLAAQNIAANRAIAADIRKRELAEKQERKRMAILAEQARIKAEKMDKLGYIYRAWTDDYVHKGTGQVVPAEFVETFYAVQTRANAA